MFAGDHPRGNQAGDRFTAVSVALRVLSVLGAGRGGARGGAARRERRLACARAARLAATPVASHLPFRPQEGLHHPAHGGVH